MTDAAIKKAADLLKHIDYQHGEIAEYQRRIDQHRAEAERARGTVEKLKSGAYTVDSLGRMIDTSTGLVVTS